MLKKLDGDKIGIFLGATVITLLLIGILVFLSWSVIDKNQMGWPFVLFLNLFVIGLPLFLTVGVFSVYRRWYRQQFPGRIKQVAWGNYALQMLLLITVMVVCVGTLVWRDSEASTYFAGGTTAEGRIILPSMVPGRGSLPLFFTIGNDSQSVRFPTAIFWWAYLGSIISILNMIMRRFSVGHLVPRAYLDSALRLIYAFIATALFYIALQIWPAALGRGQSDPMRSRYLLMLFAFLAGLFPVSITRWITSQLWELLEPEGKKQIRLTEITGIDPDTVSYLNSEGIWTVAQLATCDFDSLASRLHLDPELVSNWKNQASLLIQLNDIDLVRHFRRLGIHQWSDLHTLKAVDIKELSVEDLLQTPKANQLSPVLIHILKSKSQQRQ